MLSSMILELMTKGWTIILDMEQLIEPANSNEAGSVEKRLPLCVFVADHEKLQLHFESEFTMDPTITVDVDRRDFEDHFARWLRTSVRQVQIDMPQILQKRKETRECQE